MIGIDTNVLVRYIVQDDPKQTPIATAFLENNCTAEHPGRVCLLVLCELVWVLTRAYKYDSETVIGVLENLLTTAELEVEQSSLAWQALRAYRSGPAEFADCLIAHANAAAGAEYTFTFDRRAGRHGLFRSA
ncbi:MAG: PIN domain-containing protein [Candidatus Latescibacteria bacterium]|nr:PIN domain-containing protein [Candidatus Latescibacterota bacterium]